MAKSSPCRCYPRRGIHDAYQQEIFGPVAPILAFKDIDEAAQLAAQTGYGLSLAIQTTDIVSGAQKSVDLLENLVETADLYGARRLAATCPSSGPCTRSYVTRARQYPGRDASSC